MKVNPFYAEDKDAIALHNANHKIRDSLTGLNKSASLTFIRSAENIPGKLRRTKNITELNQNAGHPPARSLCKIEYTLLSSLSDISADKYVYCGMIAGLPRNNAGILVNDEGYLSLIKGESFDLLKGLQKKARGGYEYYLSSLTDSQCEIKLGGIYVNESGILTGEEKYSEKTYSIEISSDSGQEDIEEQYISIVFMANPSDERDKLVFEKSDGKFISFRYDTGKLWAKTVQEVDQASDLSRNYSEVKLPLKSNYQIINVKRAINVLQIAVASENKSRIFYLNPDHISANDFIARKISHKPPQIFSSRLGSDPHEKYHAGQPFSSDRKGNFSARHIPLFSSMVNNLRCHIKGSRLKKAEGRKIRAAIDIAKGVDIGIRGTYLTLSGMIESIGSGQAFHQGKKVTLSIDAWCSFLLSREKKLSGVIHDACGHRKKKSLSDLLSELIKELHVKDEIHLNSSDWVSGFLGIAVAGMPFCPGWFTGLAGGLSCSHSLSLSRTDEDSVRLTFTHEFRRGVTGMLGTGQGLERSLLSSHGLDYMTVLPAEANLIIATHFVNKKDFTFCLSNKNFMTFVRQSEQHAFDPEFKKHIIRQSELSELKEKECVIMLEAKSELRLELGGMANQNTYLVFPRSAVGVRLALNLLKSTSISQLTIDKKDNITQVNKKHTVIMSPEGDFFNETKIMPVHISNGAPTLCVPLPLTEEYQAIHQLRGDYGAEKWDSVAIKKLTFSDSIKPESARNINTFYSQQHSIDNADDIPFFLTLCHDLPVKRGMTLAQMAKCEVIVDAVRVKINKIKESLSSQQRNNLGKSCVITIVSHYDRIESYGDAPSQGYRLNNIELRRSGTLSHEAATIPLVIINFSHKSEISYHESLGGFFIFYRHDTDLTPFKIESRLQMIY